MNVQHSEDGTSYDLTLSLVAPECKNPNRLIHYWSVNSRHLYSQISILNATKREITIPKLRYFVSYMFLTLDNCHGKQTTTRQFFTGEIGPSFTGVLHVFTQPTERTTFLRAFIDPFYPLTPDLKDYRITVCELRVKCVHTLIGKPTGNEMVMIVHSGTRVSHVFWVCCRCCRCLNRNDACTVAHSRLS